MTPTYTKWGLFPIYGSVCGMTQPEQESAASQEPTPLTGRPHLDALRSSVDNLRVLTASLTEQQLTGGAYPTRWTVAQVLSHLGSAAVITQRRLEDTLAGQDTPDDFAPGVWDAWNAKSPGAQRDDALVADAALLARLGAVEADDRDRFTSTMGPITLDFAQFVGTRLNEHAFHTWDIEVVANPIATLPEQVTALVADNLELVARFTARPTGQSTTITVATTTPARGFTIDLTPESVAFTAVSHPATADLGLPAEAFARLVYGRLDAAHTPVGDHGPALDTLRRVFPGP
jgi:uncharacterized protein (TIGR03083 family)